MHIGAIVYNIPIQYIKYISFHILYSMFVLLINGRLKTALDSVMPLELGPRGLLVFEDYAKGTTGNGKRNREVIPGMSSIHPVCKGPLLNYYLI